MLDFGPKFGEIWLICALHDLFLTKIDSNKMQPMVLALLACKLYLKLSTGVRLLIQMCLICSNVSIVPPKDHSISKYAKFSEKLTSLVPLYVCISGGKKCHFFGKTCIRTK